MTYLAPVLTTHGTVTTQTCTSPPQVTIDGLSGTRATTEVNDMLVPATDGTASAQETSGSNQ